MASPAMLQGVPPATLQLWLTEAQHALHKLSTGERVASLSYAEGEGNRMVSYTRANMQDLRAWIGELQAALGVRPRARSAIGVIFR